MAPSSSGSYIARLPSDVRAIVESLPASDQEVFIYLASYDFGKLSKKQLQHTRPSSSSSSSSKAKNDATHERCYCLDCYGKYWDEWNHSPNVSVIQRALSLTEELSSRKSAWIRGRKEKKRKNKGKDCNPGHVESGEDHVENGEDHVENREDQEETPHRTEENPKTHDKKSSKKQQKDESVTKPRSKQVAPLDFKEETIQTGGASIEDEEAGNGGGRAVAKPQSFSSRASEALGFVCEKLLRMWYPRLRRRN